MYKPKLEATYLAVFGAPDIDEDLPSTSQYNIECIKLAESLAGMPQRREVLEFVATDGPVRKESVKYRQCAAVLEAGDRLITSTAVAGEYGFYALTEKGIDVYKCMVFMREYKS